MADLIPGPPEASVPPDACSVVTEIVVHGADCPWCLEETLDALRGEPGVVGVGASSTGHCLSIEHHQVDAKRLLDVVRVHLHGYDQAAGEALMVQIDPRVATLGCPHGRSAPVAARPEGSSTQQMETMLGAAARLRAQGYLHDLTATDDGRLRCGGCGLEWDPAEVEVDAVVRYEGASDPDDEEILLALRCRCGRRGLYQAAFGPGAGPGDAAVLRRLR